MTAVQALAAVHYDGVCRDRDSYNFEKQHHACSWLIRAFVLDDERSAEALYDRAKLLSRNDRPNIALRDIERAIALSPNAATYYWARGCLRTIVKPATKSVYQSALEDARLAEQLGATSSEFYQDMAQRHDELKQHRQALEDADRAIAAAPSSALEVARVVRLSALAKFNAFQSLESAASALLELSEQDWATGIAHMYQAHARCVAADLDGFISDLTAFATNPNFDLRDLLDLYRDHGGYEDPITSDMASAVKQGLRRTIALGCGHVVPPRVPG
ncbi:MAG: hypothetical protein AAF415_16545 [Pseudomonadota bacterium]